jgi:FlaA1/EpsC-like NDP-sugar epimerase/lipopolysaccharide/colanic/teichoic acid biosynthesis glycosyltransferase
MSPSRRILDVLVSAPAIVLLAPLGIIIAAAVRLADGGPVIFTQSRVGRHGRPFPMYKFRTMLPGAERLGTLVTAGGDARVTRVGRWLRRTKLDELPQLWNVLVGDMALVGPRPEVPRFVEHYSESERRVLAVRPGLTDPAALAFVDEEERLRGAADPERLYLDELMPAKLRLNLDYMARASWAGDVAILGATASCVLGRVAAVLTGGRSPARAVAAALTESSDPATASAASTPARTAAAFVIRHRRSFIVLLYAALGAAGFLAAVGLRYDFAPPRDVWMAALALLPVLLVMRLTVYQVMGLFRGYWQHFGLRDLVLTARAATLGSLLFATVLVLGGWWAWVGAAVILLDWLLAITLAGGVHVLARSIREGHLPLRDRPGQRTIVIGAGEAGERVVRQFQHEPRLGIHPVCLVDDDPAQLGRRLHGLRIDGSTADLPVLCIRYDIALLVIAVPSATPAELRALVQGCMATGLPFKVVRPVGELMEGRHQPVPLRDVQVEDLLGRPAVVLDPAPVVRELAGTVVLVTGAAGSIGSEIARQVARLGPRRLILLEQAESPLYFIHLELAHAHPDVEVVPYLCGVTNRHRLEQLFTTHNPDVVFHAAAYKHVPLMEAHVLEAVRNNIFGTLHVALAAARHGARRFVLLSTDKAVYPSSVMGATKRIAERIVLGHGGLYGAGTDFRAVRFGNVLGSDGSVIPLFRRQLAAGGPVTVTHPAVMRYFMTIPEAVQLVLQAASLPEVRGRIAMLDMGEPVRIVELAENLIRLSGLEPHRDVAITFTGLRPGEKLREDLMLAYESSIPTSAPKIRTVEMAAEVDAALPALLRRLGAALANGAEGEVLRLLRAGVPECTSPLRDVAPSDALLSDALVADVLAAEAGHGPWNGGTEREIAIRAGRDRGGDLDGGLERDVDFEFEPPPPGRPKYHPGIPSLTERIREARRPDPALEQPILPPSELR